MELKVWVEGIQRIVCGVTDATTCQDVVFALAHATGKTGRFTLIERWRNNERLLAPHESPMKILNKLGEYSSEVQFILQKSEKPNQKSQNALVDELKRSGDKLEKSFSAKDKDERLVVEEQKNFAITALNEKPENAVASVGIVKGMPQQQQQQHNKPQSTNKQQQQPQKISIVNLEQGQQQQGGTITTKIDLAMSQKSAEPINQLNRSANLSNENLLDLYNSRIASGNNSSSTSSSSPIIGTSGSLNPPPYRNPPPPKAAVVASNLSNINHILTSNINEILMQNIQYRDLVQLIKYQRDKINMQQSDLTKFDAEIIYLESKGREQLQQLETVSQELNKTYRQGNEQYVEEESELVAQQEKTLKSEMALLRSKLAILETELLQCRNKIKKLMDDIQLEQRSFNQQSNDHQQLEQKLMNEIDRLQADIDFAIQSSDNNVKTADNLKRDVMMIEMSIGEKKKQLEKLVQEMKEVNLLSLTVTTTEDYVPIEGSAKSGRRIIGSPRQLENAVATSKNPHGVWV